MPQRAQNRFPVAEHKKQGEQQDEEIDEKRKKVFEHPCEASGQIRCHLFHPLLNRSHEVQVLQGCGQVMADGVGHAHRHHDASTADQAANTDRDFHRFSPREKQHRQHRYDQDQRDTNRCKKRRLGDREAFVQEKKCREKEDCQHRGPRKWNQKRGGDSKDQITEQEQRPVGEYRG